MEKKPYYHIDAETENIIFELIKKCTDLKLGNISFSYYGYYDTDFYLTEYQNYWELSVTTHNTQRDIYRILDSKIIYQYSEKD